MLAGAGPDGSAPFARAGAGEPAQVGLRYRRMRRRTLPLSLFGLALATLPATIVSAQQPPQQGVPVRTATGTAVGYEMAGASLSESVLEGLPTRVGEALDACASEAAPLIGRSLQAHLTIAPPGSVREVRLEGEGGDAAARTCVERALGSLRFPSRRRDTTLVLELAFRQSTAEPTVDPATAAYRASVVRVLESHQPAVHACFERSRRAMESPEGRVRVELTIAADGRISRAAVPSGHLFPQLAECLTREIPQWTVPRPPTAPFPLDHRFDAHVAAYGD